MVNHPHLPKALKERNKGTDEKDERKKNTAKINGKTHS